ncbi:MAG: deoxyhypusine synthase family protein [Pirellulales bacterium]|nr:deoxyhypusine synthase family protein [Pirellulales bacterium]
MSVSSFLDKHFRHFNARETVDAARAYQTHLKDGGKMLLAMAGAMSTAEIGLSLAEMIRSGKVHAISCTAANLEEDLFNLLAHSEYKLLPDYRNLSPQDEQQLRDDGLNRVTDTCIPETVMRQMESRLVEYWREAAEKGESYFPFEYYYRLLDDPTLEKYFQIPAEASWVVAAREMEIPVYAPGFEDSTLGNIFAARVIDGTVSSHRAIRSGTEQMEHLVGWYLENSVNSPVGLFQIGGGIAGDFAICVVPLILQDLQRDVRLWSYFAQISDSTTSYGSYSGAEPNEKITWSKLDVDCPKFMINSDASVVAPLLFAYVMGH